MNHQNTTAREIAAALGKTRQTIAKRAVTESWPHEVQPTRGGKRKVFPLARLPREVCAAVLLLRAGADETAAARPLAVASSASAPQSASSLAEQDSTGFKGWQRKVMHARKRVLDSIAQLACGMPQAHAIQTLIAHAMQNRLAAPLQQAVRIANARRGRNGHKLHPATFMRWKRRYKTGGIAALAPAAQDKFKIPTWGAVLLSLWQRPQKPSLAYALEKLAQQLPAGTRTPSASMARRFLKRMATSEREAGRMLPRELKALKPFVRRDASELEPGDVYTADGHTFDAEVANPIHGQPFRPEITTVIDWVTRRIEGWSAGLAESAWTVADAWRHAVETGGVNTLFYVDRGSGFNSEPITGPVTGIEARLGVTVTNSLPYNSQARGVIERSHKTVWVRLAKEFHTYIGADMDPQAAKKVYKLTRADVRATGRSPLLPAWPEFLTRCEAAVAAYNARPHRGLPKARDLEGGRMRHLSPNEMRARFIERGFEPEMLPAAVAADLFRPYREATTLRGEVRLFNNIYFDGALAPYHGERVRVGYDIHDASRVWVRDATERLICVAKFEANKRAAFQQPVIEQAMEKRVAARQRRLEARLEEVRAELDPPLTLEYQDAIELPAMRSPLPEPEQIHVLAEVERLAVAFKRPMFDTDYQKYEWLLDHQELWTEDDRGWLGWYTSTGEWQAIYAQDPAREYRPQEET